MATATCMALLQAGQPIVINASPPGSGKGDGGNWVGK
jgi:hypothetical protein